MRNVHVIPADREPVRGDVLLRHIWKNSPNECISWWRYNETVDIDNVRQYTTLNGSFRDIVSAFKVQNVYITSEEEIKDGEYGICLNLVREGFKSHQAVFKMDSEQRQAMEELGGQKKAEVLKVILTTDQDLIKDGVQAIDNEFLEWFVKNPSCGFADISTYHIKGDISGKLHYKIIIPKEEAKQECICDSENDKWVCTINCKNKESKQECECTDECLGYSTKNCKGLDYDRTYQPISLSEVDEEESKQQTIEEAAYNYASKKLKRPITIYTPLEANVAEYVGFFDGAEWKEQNSDKKWSDNDIINALHSVELKHNKNYTPIYDEMKKWLNESKTK